MTALAPHTVFAPVTLVGAGPGDPDDLTLKAVKAIAQADVLYVDDLVNTAVLAHARADARVIHVGKRGGCASTPQAFIIRAMIAAAKAGNQVVRLKGGDPFIFGRGGEEVEALNAAGIACQVVNGITAGLAALTTLNTPLTHRDHAHGVVFVTGHGKPGASRLDWVDLGRTAAQAKLTLVVYMGVSTVADIEADLAVGLPPDTPIALIQNATLPNQRQAFGTLASLRDTMTTHQITSPAIMVIGDVVKGLLAASQAPHQAPSYNPVHGAARLQACA
ncbi:MAG: uroporphyrinogen-III C-methyltransferase [Burkholderiaceae bacterium]